MKIPRAGFTLIEMMAVVAVIAILALIAVPGIQDRVVREQIVEAMHVAEIAKAPIAASWAFSHTLPADNPAAGLPVADKIVGNFVTSLVVEAGAIHVTFGNRANAAIQGKTLTLRPAVVEDAPVVPVAALALRLEPRRAGVFLSALAAGTLLAAAVLARALGAVRMMVRCGTDTKEDPGRPGVAVRGGPPSPRSRGGLRRPVGCVRPLSPAEGQRRSHGEWDRRARHARDGGRRQGGQVLR